jgi:putative photosynthetic complex assembly protein
MSTAQPSHRGMRIPKSLALIAVGGLAALILFVADYVDSGKLTREADAQAVITKQLRFEDRSDGSIAVISASDGRVVKVIEGEAGFVRGILRAMARERRIKEVNQTIPFELIARADGRLTLLDPATGNRIDLESFGKDNVIEFAVLLKPQGAR